MKKINPTSKNKYPTECTTIIVGNKATEDGSRIVARSEDWDALEAKNLEIYQDTNNGPQEFIAKDSPFRCPLPKKRYGYTALAPYSLPGHWGSAGFNTQGVGMSSTESIFSNQATLKVDPLITNGIGENCVFNIVLPYIKTARQGILRLGSLIEKHGISEGFGIGFIDKNEIWYLETAGGHHYLACHMKDDQYFCTGNQSRFREYDPEDKINFMASKDLIDFAIQNKLYNPSSGKFDFHTAYSQDIESDKTYNYPRVWGIQKMLSPKIKNDITKNTFPVFAFPKKPISITDLRTAFRFHYNGTEHDPYLNNNPNEPYRPISIMRTTQTHILKVHPNMPQAIGEVDYMAMGMAALGVFLPYYQGITKYLEPYTKGINVSSNNSAYWKFRKVQALGMTNYNKYAPIIQETYSTLEAENDQRMKEMEIEYLSIYKDQPIKAKELIQNFSENIMQKALDVTDELIEKLFTQITIDIQSEYLFHGA